MRMPKTQNQQATITTNPSPPKKCRVADGGQIVARDKKQTPSHTFKRKVIMSGENGRTNIAMMVKGMDMNHNNDQVFTKPDGGDVSEKKRKPHLQGKLTALLLIKAQKNKVKENG